MALEEQSFQTEIYSDELVGPYAGKTILSLVGEMYDFGQASQAQRTQFPFETNTKSGSGLAQMTDDSDNEYLYD